MASLASGSHKGLVLQQISAGGGFTCGVTFKGTAYCWGYNGNGELGNGTLTNSAKPALVAGGLPFQSVHAGHQHACGLTTDGAVYCWGSNSASQLGLLLPPPAGRVTTPALVAAASAATQLSTHDSHNCLVTTTGGAECWGYNTYGSVGDGTSGNVRVVPTAVSLVLPVTTVGAGSFGSCAVVSDSGLAPAYCWGDGLSLGNGSFTSSSTPVPVFGGLSFTQVTLGGAHTCAATSSGEVYCWGSNFTGQLGIGSTANSSVPVPVGGLPPVAKLDAGHSHVCAVSITGKAYCWGENDWGKLGTGDAVSTTTPVAVSGGLVFAAISAGFSHTCALTTTGNAYCWGENPQGALGNGTVTNSSTPVPVAAR